MSTPSIFAAAVLAVVCPFLVAQDAPAPAKTAPAEAAVGRPQAAAPTIASVDLVKAIEQYPKWIQKQGELSKMRDGMRSQIEQAKQRLEDLKTKIGMQAADSAERKRDEFELDLAARQLQFTVGSMEDHWEREYDRSMLEVFEDLEVYLAKVAKARGILLVVRVYDLPPAGADLAKLTDKDVGARRGMMERRQVWYAAPEIDLTTDLIKAMQVPLPPRKPPADAGAEHAGPKPGGAPQQGAK